LVIIPWLMKWLRIPNPCSSDDPNTESTLPFVVENLPVEIANGFEPLTHELAGLGFFDPVYHAIHDDGTRTTIYWATFRHDSGKYIARIHQRLWQQAANPNRALFPMFFTPFSDGSFLVSSAGKPDMASPKTVTMNRMPRATPGRLWAKHQQLSDKLESRKLIAPVKTREDLIAVTEQHHVLLRDFHLARGVFRPRTEAEQAGAEAFAARVAEVQASGLEHAEVMAELDKLQEKKSGWGATGWMLVGSVVLFIALGAARWNWQITLWLIPVLFFHECGHWVAMRIFHYRNLRMFFIPLFGAAVMGQNWNVPGWKKALVSLAGPLPGIALGIVLGVVGLLLRKVWLDQAALMLLFINGFNLLPVLPLDGGHVLHTTLFCRNRWLDVTFRILAIVALFLLSVAGLGKVFMYLAIFMAISLPLAFKLAKVTDTLRKTDLPSPSPDEDRIPVPTAQAIITAVKEVLPKKVSNKTIAQHTVNIFETLNARPPGALGTIGLLTLHGGAFFLAIVFSLLLFVGKMGGLGDFALAAARQPQHAFQCGDWQTWQTDEARKNPLPAKNLLVATFKNHLKAVSAFSDLTNHAGSVTLFGDSVLLALPANDDAAPDKWFDQLQTLTTNVFVAPSNQPVIVNLTCIAPTLVAATNLTRDLKDYFEVGGGMHLIPPWSPEASASDFPAKRQAREDWRRIGLELGKVWADPALKPYSAKIQAAVKRGDLAEQNRIEAEEKTVRAELQAKKREQLRTDATHPVAAGLLDLQARLSGLNYTNKVERAAILAELAPKLGQIKFAGDRSAPGADAYGAVSGMVSRHSLLIEISWLSLNDAPTGLPTLSDWLCNLNCKGTRYDFVGSFPATASDDSDE
jgi:Zn-dependent protease